MTTGHKRALYRWKFKVSGVSQPAPTSISVKARDEAEALEVARRRLAAQHQVGYADLTLTHRSTST